MGPTTANSILWYIAQKQLNRVLYQVVSKQIIYSYASKYHICCIIVGCITPQGPFACGGGPRRRRIRVLRDRERGGGCHRLGRRRGAHLPSHLTPTSPLVLPHSGLGHAGYTRVCSQCAFVDEMPGGTQRGFHPTRNPSTGWFKIPPAVPLSPRCHSVPGFLQG